MVNNSSSQSSVFSRVLNAAADSPCRDRRPVSYSRQADDCPLTTWFSRVCLIASSRGLIPDCPPCRDYVPLANLIGVIFQIRDDYMNLQSSQYADNKGFCEDLTEGKFSFPIVHSIRADSSNQRLLSPYLPIPPSRPRVTITLLLQTSSDSVRPTSPRKPTPSRTCATTLRAFATHFPS